jgi:hypothetical protein
MPIYLVRWNNLSCSLVRAHDRAEVLDILDELANVEGVEVKRYDGPLFLDFTLATDRTMPLRDGIVRDERALLSGQDIEVGDVQALADGELPRVQIPGTDTGHDMYKALLAGAFPHLHRALFVDGDPDQDTADVEQVKAAVHKEAMALVRASWRRARVARSDDPVSALAVMLGTSTECVRDIQRQAEEDDE